MCLLASSDAAVVYFQVRHPKVKERMFLDFALMKKVANFADRRPSLKWMNLGPSMEQFSNTMSAQVRFGRPARHQRLEVMAFVEHAHGSCAYVLLLLFPRDIFLHFFRVHNGFSCRERPHVSTPCLPTRENNPVLRVTATVNTLFQRISSTTFCSSVFLPVCCVVAEGCRPTWCWRRSTWTTST